MQGVSPYNARQFQNQRRGLNSPSGGVPGGAPVGAAAGLQRQNSFQAADASGNASNYVGPSPNSPHQSPQSPYGNAAANVFQQQQQMQQRMQRQSSLPQQQHLPGKCINSNFLNNIKKCKFPYPLNYT